jgi:outer membrane biosynthesis protein TonB
MDRAEAAGLGVAVTGHVALLVVLSAGFITASQPPIVESAPIEVSFAEDVGLVSAAPQPTVEPPAQSVAPDLGLPDEPAPAPVVEPAPPRPVPPTPKQVQTPPEPKAAPREAVKAAPAPTPPASEAPRKNAPVASAGKAETPRGSRLGSDFLKGIGADPSPSRSQQATGAVMNARAQADIGSAILRQVQPCANRQVSPGPGAERIRVTMQLLLNRDGSLRSRPRVIARDGVDDENRRYQERVEDLAIATFAGCSPLRGLPAELYDVPNGWSDFKLRYKLPG